MTLPHSELEINTQKIPDLVGSRYLFRFEDTDGYMMRFEVVGLGKDRVDLLAIDWPHLSRSITFDQFMKGLSLMNRKFNEMDAVTACLLYNLVTIDGFTST